jgi:ABC-2 type transport system permease protein
MLFRIARKEFTEMIRDGRIRWAVVVINILLLASLVSGWRQYAAARKQLDLVQHQERERWLNKGEMHPHGAAHYGYFVFKPQTPLSAIEHGTDPYTGVATLLEAHQQKLFQYRPAQDGVPAQRIVELTASTTLQFLLPLVIILLLFGLFAGERERGTLRQLLSVGVSKSRLAAGKVIGVVVPLFLALTPVTIIGVVAIEFTSGAEIYATTPRIAVMALSYLLYFGVFVGLALAVSALASSSRQALVLLLAFWLINLAASPIAINLACYLYPAPNGFEFSAAIMEDKQRLPTFEESRTQLLKQYGVASADELPAGFELLSEEERDTRLYEKHFNRLYDAYEYQNRAYRMGAVAAPLIAMESLSMGLSGSDFAHFRNFVQAAEAYRRQMVRTLNEDLVFNNHPGNQRQSLWFQNTQDYRAGRDLWEKVPPFRYDSPGLNWAVKECRFSLVVLLLWVIGAAVAAPVAITKMKVD